MTFARQARRLAGQAGAVLHWSPDQFWNATPEELAVIFVALRGESAAPTGADDLARLMEAFPDG